MSTVGDGLNAENANWKFDGKVAENFDSHVSKSVPYYSDGHVLVQNLSDFFIKSNSTCYEIGCSTGSLTLALANHNQGKENTRIIGIDIEQDMIDAASKKSASSHLCGSDSPSM